MDVSGQDKLACHVHSSSSPGQGEEEAQVLQGFVLRRREQFGGARDLDVSHALGPH